MKLKNRHLEFGDLKRKSVFFYLSSHRCQRSSLHLPLLLPLLFSSLSFVFSSVRGQATQTQMYFFWKKKKTNGGSEMTWFWISKGKLNYCQSKVCVSCWFFSRWLFQFKFLVEEANNWIEEPVYRLVMWEAERGNTELYTFHIRAKSNGVQAWNRRKRGYMNKVIEEEIWCTVSFF